MFKASDKMSRSQLPDNVEPNGEQNQPRAVIADSLRFKQRLRIGDDAYAILRAKKRVGEVWETAGAAATGAGVASSSLVAGTFFAPTGLMASLGLAGAAVTPIGWVVAAGVVAGGGYFGLARLMNTSVGSLTDTIPKFINTPIDILGAGLLDLHGALAVRFSAIDAEIDARERAAMVEHFVQDWGYDQEYVKRTLDVLAENVGDIRIKTVAMELAQFLNANPDCGSAAMQKEMLDFLRELARADGILDEREEFALDAVEATFRRTSRLSADKAGQTLSKWTSEAGSRIVDLGRGASELSTRAAKRARAIIRKE